MPNQVVARGSASSVILVVDDDQDLRETVSDALVACGHDVATARNGAEALAYLRSSPAPALVLLDLSMPVLDGVGFCEQIRGDPQLASIPVVILSAASNARAKVAELDVAGFLPKPVSLDDLATTARRFAVPH